MNSDKILLDLIESAIEARAHFQIRWALANEARPKHVATMNLFPNFFIAMQRAHFDSMAVNFGHLFDERSDSSSFKRYLRVARNEFTSGELSSYRKRVDQLSRSAKDFLDIRHKTVAHQDATLSEQQVFQTADVAPDFNRDLIENSAKFVEEFRCRKGWTSGIFESQRYSEATLSMLQVLEQFRGMRRKA